MVTRFPRGSAIVRRREEPPPIRILPDQPLAAPHHAVYGTNESSRLSEFVEMLDDGLLVRQRTVETDPAHRHDPAHRIGEIRRCHVAIDEPRRNPMVRKGRLDHHAGRVLTGGGRERSRQQFKETWRLGHTDSWSRPRGRIFHSTGALRVQNRRSCPAASCESLRNVLDSCGSAGGSAQAGLSDGRQAMRARARRAGLRNCAHGCSRSAARRRRRLAWQSTPRAHP